MGRSADKLGEVCVATFHVTAVWVDCVTGTAVTLHDSPLSMSLSSLLPSPGKLREKRSIRSRSTCEDCLLSLAWIWTTVAPAVPKGTIWSLRFVMAGKICDPLELAIEAMLPRRVLRASFVIAGKICDPLELAWEVMLPLRRSAIFLPPRRMFRFRPPWRKCSLVSRSRSVVCWEWTEYWESNEWRRDWLALDSTEIRRTALMLISESRLLRRKPKAPAAPTIAPRRVTNFGIAAAHAELTSLEAALLRSRLPKPTGSSWVLCILMDIRPMWFRSRRLANAWAMILCLRMRTRSSNGLLLNVLETITSVRLTFHGNAKNFVVYLRYHLRQARTDAFVQTQDETATPAPKTAIKWTWVIVILGRDSSSQSSAKPWFWILEVFWFAKHLSKN